MIDIIVPPTYILFYLIPSSLKFYLFPLDHSIAHNCKITVKSYRKRKWYITPKQPLIVVLYTVYICYYGNQKNIKTVVLSLSHTRFKHISLQLMLLGITKFSSQGHILQSATYFKLVLTDRQKKIKWYIWVCVCACKFNKCLELSRIKLCTFRA